MKKNGEIQAKWRDTINNIISSDVVEKIIGNELFIKENGKLAKNQEVHIKYLSSNCHAFRMDLQPHSIYLFQNDIKINDELLLYIEKDKITIFIIELKSNNPKDAIPQIRNGKLCADLLIGILEAKIGYQFPNREYRGYIFTSRQNGKNTVSRKGFLKYDSILDKNIYIKVFNKSSFYSFKELSCPMKDI